LAISVVDYGCAAVCHPGNVEELARRAQEGLAVRVVGLLWQLHPVVSKGWTVIMLADQSL